MADPVRDHRGGVPKASLLDHLALLDAGGHLRPRSGEAPAPTPATRPRRHGLGRPRPKPHRCHCGGACASCRGHAHAHAHDHDHEDAPARLRAFRAGLLLRLGRATACPNTPPGGKGFGPGNDCWKNLADKRATKQADRLEQAGREGRAQALRKRVERGLVTGPERRQEAEKKKGERAERAKSPAPSQPKSAIPPTPGLTETPTPGKKVVSTAGEGPAGTAPRKGGGGMWTDEDRSAAKAPRINPKFIQQRETTLLHTAKDSPHRPALQAEVDGLRDTYERQQRLLDAAQKLGFYPNKYDIKDPGTNEMIPAQRGFTRKDPETGRYVGVTRQAVMDAVLSAEQHG